MDYLSSAGDALMRSVMDMAGATPRPAAAGVPTPAERKRAKERRLGEAFDSFDTNGDGEIDFGEFEKAMSMATAGGEPLAQSEIRSLFAEVDSNGDGRIQKREYVNWVMARVPPATVRNVLEICGTDFLAKHEKAFEADGYKVCVGPFHVLSHTFPL